MSPTDPAFRVERERAAAEVVLFLCAACEPAGIGTFVMNGNWAVEIFGGHKFLGQLSIRN